MSAAVHPEPQRRPSAKAKREAVAAALERLVRRAQEAIAAPAAAREKARAALAQWDRAVSPRSEHPAAAASRPEQPATAANLPAEQPLSPAAARSPCSASASDSVQLGSPLSVSGCNPLLPSPTGLPRRGSALAAAGAALSPRSPGPRPAPDARPAGGDHSGITGRLGDGLDAGSYAESEDRIGMIQDLMGARTLHREDYPKAGEYVPDLLDWVVGLPEIFNRDFSAAEREGLGRMYNPRDPQPVQFHDEDIIQGDEERMPGGGCTPRTNLRHCGVHGTTHLTTCACTTSCLHSGDSRGAATCLLDNFVRVGMRIIAALRGKQPKLPSAHLSDELITALEKAPPDEVAEGILAIFMYSYEIKAPAGTPKCNGGSRPTQLYRLLGCSMRSLGDPVARGRLADEQRGLWQRVVELLRPFHWRLDRMLLALPHQPRVVYRGIDVRVSKGYDVGSIVLWPPVTSTSASKDVAWEFMSPEGSGTFFIILTLSVADIAPFSWLPAEEEWLLHTLSVHKVTDIMRPGLRAIIGTNHDMICLVQVDRRTPRPPPHQMVRARALALRTQTMLFDYFLSTYVAPAVTVGCTAEGVPDGAERQALLPVVREWCASTTSRTALIVGEAGSGKTATSLWLARTAAAERDPLPLPPGLEGMYVPIHVILPVVENLLARGTGNGRTLRPLTDYIVKSNNLSPEELAEMKKLPLLFILDGLEEIPNGLSRLRGRGLLDAGGLDLDEWPCAKVVVCIRRDMLSQSRGCTRWQLTERDVLPEGDLWHLQDFSQTEVEDFTAKALRREIVSFVKVAVESQPGNCDEVVSKAIGALRCAPPPLDAARDLVAVARRLTAKGAATAPAVQEAVDCSAAGLACREAMQASNARVIARVREADPALVTSPFVLSMLVSVGKVLTHTDFSCGLRRAIYGAWTAAEVRRRLPRIAGLADHCPEYAAMDEDARVALVLRYSGALACSPLFINVVPSVFLIALLRRYAYVAHISDYELSPLGTEHNATLLEAAPLRVETGAGALLSFPHASVQDYFAADWAAQQSVPEEAVRHPDVQRLALAIPRSPSLQEATREALRCITGDAVTRLRRRIRILRCAQVAWACAICVDMVEGAMWATHWVDWLVTAGYGLLYVQLCFPRGRRRQGVQWHHVHNGLAFAAILCGYVWEMWLCTTVYEHASQHGLCAWYPVWSTLHFFGSVIPITVMLTEPQFIVAAFGRLNIYEWNSVSHRLCTLAATAAFFGFWVTRIAFSLPHLRAEHALIFITAALASVLLLGLLRLPARVRRR